MAYHAYKCPDCGAEQDVKVMLGEDSQPPACPNNEDHAMKRSWSLSGFSIEW